MGRASQSVSHLVISPVNSLCVGHNQLELFRKLLQPARGVSACGNAHFRVPDTSLRILIVDGVPEFGRLVVLQFHLETSDPRQAERMINFANLENQRELQRDTITPGPFAITG